MAIFHSEKLNFYAKSAFLVEVIHQEVQLQNIFVMLYFV